MHNAALKAFLIEHNLTITALASALKVDFKTIIRWSEFPELTRMQTLALNSLRQELLEHAYSPPKRDYAHTCFWTAPEDAELKAGLDAGLTQVEISRKLGRSIKAVRSRLARLLRHSEMPAEQRDSLSRREWTPAEDAAIVAGIAQELTYLEIAIKLGRSARAVATRYQRFLLETPIGTRRIGRPPRRAWTKEESDRALKLHAAGLSCPEIGAQLGRHRTAVHDHIRLATADPKKRAELKARAKAKTERSHQSAREREAKLLGLPPPPIKIDPEVLEERAHRRALEPRDLTAALMGDPPVGYSALEQARRK